MNDKTPFIADQGISLLKPGVDQLMTTKPFEGVKKMRATWFDQGVEEGRRETLRVLIEERFGPLPKRANRRLRSLAPEQVASLVKQVLKVKSLRELGLMD